MTKDDVAEKVANNVLLTAIGRIATPAFIGLFTLVLLPLAAWYLHATNDAIAQGQDATVRLADRVTIVEVNQKNGVDRGLQMQATLHDIQAQISLLLQQTAAINATLRDRPEPGSTP